MEEFKCPKCKKECALIHCSAGGDRNNKFEIKECFKCHSLFKIIWKLEKMVELREGNEQDILIVKEGELTKQQKKVIKKALGKAGYGTTKGANKRSVK